jgi:hypothetical protein
MIFIDRGFLYRRGVRIKELGERMGRIPFIRVFSGAVISLGLAFIDRAVNYGSIGEEK